MWDLGFIIIYLFPVVSFSCISLVEVSNKKVTKIAQGFQSGTHLIMTQYTLTYHILHKKLQEYSTIRFG